jgi:deoxyadenosine/deoxycytidine kinase
MTVLSIIAKDLQQGVKKRIIGLDVDLETCKQRINKRGRDGESGYSDEYLNQIIIYYKNVYNLKCKNKPLRLTSFDALLEDNRC